MATSPDETGRSIADPAKLEYEEALPLWGGLRRWLADAFG